MNLAMLENFDGSLLELGWSFVGSFSWPLLCFGAWMTLRWKLFMALAMLGSLNGTSLGASHGPGYAWELRWVLIGSFSWPLLCLGALMALFFGVSHGTCYALELGWPFVGSFS